MKIFVNGVFDLLHSGHVSLLNYAKNLGDFLLVAIDSDEVVKSLKGPGRPIVNQDDRKFLLENLRAVDRVVIFRSQEHLEAIISQYQPDIMVKGSDHQNKPIVGAQYCRKIEFFPRITKYATTKTIESISSR